jgi:diadenosine tetraphosphate (Ap4A) HIT family hydrolase
VTDHQHALTAFRETFRLDELTVVEGERWTLSVRPDQITLASMVISHRAGALDFASLRPGDGDGFTDLVAVAERAAKALYGAIRLNVICLMMKDPIVHFHVLPRYDAPVERHGRTWTDEDWPGAPTIAPAPTSDREQHAVRDDLRAHLG